ncbi:hypothetical protein Isop_1313 [Isosphaera pallida ATCC 43644]|uniref:Uncharacterized protein n=1 Tax=Isosphaera pallida (strain ATCC 43644 / DSM 9630 / IS1B) TaxID=575540 RepID=E8QWK7_ISOPI|nr:hypothetical protein Isop_1313 [Isosphaera pallida ATCC 43644]
MAADEVSAQTWARWSNWLAARRHDRGGEAEYRFDAWDRCPKLPILRDGHLTLARWGNLRGQSRHLPRTAWTWLRTVEQGSWRHLDPLEVVIPATLAFERGVWYRVRQGIRGLLVPDERGWAVCYMICQPSSHYYYVMTRSAHMPVLIGETI